MKEYPPDKVRNIALIGHGSTGKTSLAEAMLFASGATTRLGRVEDGTTVSDWDPDEQKRGVSVKLPVVPLEADGHKINVVDAPRPPARSEGGRGPAGDEGLRGREGRAAGGPRRAGRGGQRLPRKAHRGSGGDRRRPHREVPGRRRAHPGGAGG